MAGLLRRPGFAALRDLRTGLLLTTALGTVPLPPLPPPPDPLPPPVGVEDGRVAPMRVDEDGRPFTVPQAYWDSVAAEMAAERAAGLIGLTSTITHVAVQSGSWSSPATWGLAAGAAVPGLPGALDAVPRIPPGISVTVNVPLATAPIQLRDCQVDQGGRIRWPSAIKTQMIVSTLNCEGDWIFGTHDAPVNSEIRIRPMEDPGISTRVGVVTHMHSRVRECGKDKTPFAWPQDMAAGDTVIRLAEIPADWAADDELLIPSRTAAGTSATDPFGYQPVEYWNADSGPDTGGAARERPTVARNARFQLSHDERRIIRSIDRAAGTITLTQALSYAHGTLTRTNKHTGYVSTLRPRLANLSVTAVIRAHDPINGMKDARGEVIRGHVMHMHSDDVDKRCYAHVDLGRTRTDVTLTTANSDILWTVDRSSGTAKQGTAHPNDPGNVRGRYADHIHRTGPYRARRPVVVHRARWYNTVGAPINPGWAFSHHSSFVHVEECIAHGARGALIVSERGDEIGQWIGNLMCHSPGDGWPPGWGRRIERVQNHNGSSGMGCEMQSRSVILQDNEVTSCNYSYFWLQQNQEGWLRQVAARDNRIWDPVTSGGKGKGGYADEYFDDLDYGVEEPQILELLRNHAVDCDDAAFFGHRQEAGRNNTTPMIARDFQAWWVRGQGWRVINYSGRYHLHDACFVGVPSRGNYAIYRGAQSYWFINKGIYAENFDAALYDEDTNYGGDEIDFDWQNNVPTYGTHGVIGIDYPIEQHALAGVYGEPIFVKTENGLNHYRLREAVARRSSDYPLPLPGKGRMTEWPQIGYPDVPAGMESVPRPWFRLDPTSKLDLYYNKIDTLKYRGTMADGCGVFRWPDWFTLNGAKANSYSNNHRDQENLNNGGSGQYLVERNGCFLDPADGLWKSRFWHTDADRLTGKYIQIYVDVVLRGPGHPGAPSGVIAYPEAFLLANRSRKADGSYGPREAPVLPLKMESILPQFTLPVPELAPMRGDWTLLNEAAAPVTQAMLGGRWTLLYFGYTNCPAVCPAELSKMVELQQALPAANLQLVYVSIDPARDTPSVMGAHVAQFGGGLRGLTGSQAQVDAIRQLYDIEATAAEAVAGGYAVSHTTDTFLIGPDGRCRRVFGADLPQAARRTAITAEVAAG